MLSKKRAMSPKNRSPTQAYALSPIQEVTDQKLLWLLELVVTGLMGAIVVTTSLSVWLAVVSILQPFLTQLVDGPHQKLGMFLFGTLSSGLLCVTVPLLAFQKFCRFMSIVLGAREN